MKDSEKFLRSQLAKVTEERDELEQKWCQVHSRKRVRLESKLDRTRDERDEARKKLKTAEQTRDIYKGALEEVAEKCRLDALQYRFNENSERGYGMWMAATGNIATQALAQTNTQPQGGD